MLLSIAWSATAFASGEKTGTTTLTAIVPYPEGTTFTVSFDPNGGTGVMASVTVNAGEEYTLPENSFYAPAGKEFNSWDKGLPGVKITIEGDMVITAQWKDAPDVPGEKTGTTTLTAIVPYPEGTTFTVSFDPNGGTGTMASVTVNAGEEYTLPANGFNAPTGKEFNGWDKGLPGVKITIEGDTVITAQWKDAPDVPPAVPPTVTPDVTPEVTPAIIPTVMPDITPEVTHTVPPAVTPEVTPAVPPTVTPEITPAVTQPPMTRPPVTPKPYVPDDSGYDFRFTFTKTWQGDHEASIDWVLYNPDGTVAHKKFNKKIVSENEWRYEAWFASGADYYIIETVPAGYKAVYENVGAHAGETDRCYNGGKIINYKLPKTGDPADLRLWTGMALMGLGVACGAVMIGRRKKAQR